MGNSSLGFMLEFSCSDANISRSSVTPEFWDTHSVSSTFRSGAITEATILLLFSLVGIPSNAIIILCIVKGKLYKQTTHILLLNLAISDFLVCMFVLPPIVISGFAGGFIYGESDFQRCQVCQSVMIFIALVLLSVNVVGLASLDRFVYIKYPLRYDQLVTVPRVIVAVILAWVLSIFQAILPLAEFGQYNYSFTVSTCTPDFFEGTGNLYVIFTLCLAFIPVAVTIITNIWIACIARRQIKVIYQIEDDVKKEGNQNMKKEIFSERGRKQLALVRAFGVIIIVNLMVWMPIVIFTILSFVLSDEAIPIGYYIFAYITVVSQSVLHPLIEGCFIPDIKETFKVAFGMKFCERIFKNKQLTETVAESNLS